VIARAQCGDIAAMDTLLVSVQLPLFRHIAMVMDGDQQAAEDALQEALLAICRHVGGLRDPRWFRAWAYRIATRIAVRHAKRSRRQPDAVPPEALAEVAADPPDEVPEEAVLAALHSALSAVPRASQLVLRMHYFDEMTHLEIAEALELPLGTVKSRLHYGLASLRKVIRPEEP